MGLYYTLIVPMYHKCQMKPIRELLVKIDTNVNIAATSSNFQTWVRYSLLHLQKNLAQNKISFFYLYLSADIRMPCQKYITQLWKFSIGCTTLPLFFIGKNISKGKDFSSVKWPCFLMK